MRCGSKNAPGLIPDTMICPLMFINEEMPCLSSIFLPAQDGIGYKGRVTLPLWTSVCNRSVIVVETDHVTTNKDESTE